MNCFIKTGTRIAFVALLLGGPLIMLGADDSKDSEPAVYAPPAAADVRSEALQWVALQRPEDSELLKQVGVLWSDVDRGTSARLLLDRAIATFALVDPSSRKLIEACDPRTEQLIDPPAGLLDRSDVPFHRQNLGLFYARYLTRQEMYDEALDQFAKLDPGQVIDPATLLFYRAVCEHQLLVSEPARQPDQPGELVAKQTLKTLLERTERVPASYATVANLMQYELQNFRAGSLDEVARRMSDVERRLELARAGRRVQRQERKVVELLDEIIKKIEQQQGGGGGAGASGSPKGNQSGSPAAQSGVGGAQGPGETDDKDLGRKNGWGALPPKAETKAKNLINREFPSHYRQAIEQYLKKLARRPAAQ